MTGRTIRCKAAILIALAGSMSACGSDSSSQQGSSPASPTAATLGEQQPKTVSEYLSSAPYSDADLDNGSRLATTCRACHTLDQGGVDRIGPNLHGFFGREAGARAGFDYSAALSEAEFVWTPRALDAWLAAPVRFLPGNRMIFAAVSDASDRADLVAYMLRETSAE